MMLLAICAWFFTSADADTYTVVRNLSAEPASVAVVYRDSEGTATLGPTQLVAGRGVAVWSARATVPVGQGSVEVVGPSAATLLPMVTLLAPLTGLAVDVPCKAAVVLPFPD